MPDHSSLPSRPAHLPRLLQRALQLTATEWVLLFVAIAELLRARVALLTFSMESLTATPSDTNAPAPQPLQLARATRISWAIQSAAARVPWRSDCLVQALAAKRWLTREQIPSQLNLGVRVNASNIIEAHAWLRCDNVVVTGGNIDDYVTLVQSGTRSS